MSNTDLNADCGRWPWPYPLIPTIPQIYMDAVSVEQQIKDLHCWLNSLSLYATTELNYDDEITAINTALSQLEDAIQDIEQGSLEEHYVALLSAWINEHTSTLYELMCKQVFFALNDDGYFVAYVPDSWADITFYTEGDTASSDYGKLQLWY